MSTLAWVGGILLAIGTIMFIAAAIWYIYNVTNAKKTGWYVWTMLGIGALLFLIGLGLTIVYISKNKKRKVNAADEEED